VSSPAPARRPRLFVVCGLGRSGTTLVGALLNRSPLVEVCNEIPHLSLFPAFGELVRQYRGWAGAMQQNPYEAWRGLGPEVVERRAEDLFVAFARALKPEVPPGSARWDAAPKPEARVLCLKRPELELDADPYETLFGEGRPGYVYCIRDPVGIFASTLAVPWGAGQDPAAFALKLGRSVAAIARLAEAPPPGRVLVVNVDAAFRDTGVRESLVRRLLAFVGVPPCEAVERFVREWPPVNRSRQHYGDREFESADARDARVRELRELIERDGPLAAAVRRLLQAGAP
jgi:hypothetical protein